MFCCCLFRIYAHFSLTSCSFVRKGKRRGGLPPTTPPRFPTPNSFSVPFESTTSKTKHLHGGKKDEIHISFLCSIVFLGILQMLSVWLTCFWWRQPAALLRPHMETYPDDGDSPSSSTPSPTPLLFGGESTLGSNNRSRDLPPPFFAEIAPSPGFHPRISA